MLYINTDIAANDNFKILGSAKVIFLLTRTRTIKFFMILNYPETGFSEREGKSNPFFYSCNFFENIY